MKKIINETTYRISRSPSIFTDRNNASKKQQDCCICVGSRNRADGGDYDDGLWFRCIARIACEGGEFLRHYELIPSQLSNSDLQRLGYLDGAS